MLGAGISTRDKMHLLKSVLHFSPRAHGISLDVPRTLAQSLLDTMQKADLQTIAFPPSGRLPGVDCVCFCCPCLTI